MLGAIETGKKIMEVGSKLVETQKKMKQVVDNVEALVPLLEEIREDIRAIKECQRHHGEILSKIDGTKNDSIQNTWPKQYF